ncbi:hypothetical protein SAMD00019534_114730 [Acytostelium subglobosum LB1]|uniref:hypothetical protein n=1 Tax=Acytostelium subglobosum LB1 TaxID=1410327 RepID=UPI000644F02F|nr:hypothetical protein SAMD00019534_114730 [Acytostelium subglobosum LB1]GAM28297.1 hypothetical protein SAMD00019534_114730 [Acytostelium subglobosum LB1]|eukprot:XP_012748614.1 hypothetical protein SAMD00019534_114730 [Acytostelium subglobosum LB1]
MTSKVWYITGCSTGIGASLVKLLLENGQKVAATSRNKQALIDGIGAPAKTHSDSFLPLVVNLADETSIKNSVTETTNKFGTIDVLVNNAGCGLAGTLEELPISDIKEHFEINFFASLYVYRAVAPVMRAKKSGLIMNVTSILANVGLVSFGAYSATKAALEMATESMDAELKDFGIRVLTINPGSFKTDIASPTKFKRAPNTIPDYEPLHKILASGKTIPPMNGDPDKLAKLLLKLSTVPAETLPQHMYIGVDSYNLAKQKAEGWIKDLETWKADSTSTNFDGVQ